MRSRKMIQLISLLLFPITLYYFSPYVIIMGITEKVISGSFVVFSFLLFISLFTGRIFCSTICPAGAVQDILTDIHLKPIKNKKINISKWIVFLIWMGIMVLLAVQAGGLHQVDIFYQTKYGVSISEPGGYIIYYAVLGVFMILAVTLGKRGGCHTICWMAPFMIVGQKVGRILKLPQYQLVSKKGCISCKKCNTVCPMSIDIEALVEKNHMVDSDCITCKKCVSACPKQVLDLKWTK